MLVRAPIVDTNRTQIAVLQYRRRTNRIGGLGFPFTTRADTRLAPERARGDRITMILEGRNIHGLIAPLSALIFGAKN